MPDIGGLLGGLTGGAGGAGGPVEPGWTTSSAAWAGCSEDSKQ